MITLCNRTSRPTQSWLKSWGSLPSLESSLPAAAAKETTCWPWWTACDLSLLMDTPPRKCVVKGIIRQSVLSSRGLCPHLRAHGTDLTCSWKNLQLCVRLKSRVMRARGKWQNWEVNNQECVGWAWSCRTRVVALLSFEKKIYLLKKSFIHVSVLQVWHLFVNCQTAVSLWCKKRCIPYWHTSSDTYNDASFGCILRRKVHFYFYFCYNVENGVHFNEKAVRSHYNVVEAGKKTLSALPQSEWIYYKSLFWYAIWVYPTQCCTHFTLMTSKPNNLFQLHTTPLIVWLRPRNVQAEGNSTVI